MSAAGPELVVFDFDGTLTRTDTLVPFLGSVDPGRTARHAPVAVATALRRPERRDAVKEQLIARVLRHRSPAQVDAAGARFARTVLPRLWRSDVLAHLRAHQGVGRVVALASASPEAVVRPAAALLGIDHVVCTRLARSTVGGWCYADGNCRGVAKRDRVERLRAQLGAASLWAYGNLPDDAPVLDAADVAVVVDRQRLRPLTPGPPAVG